MDLVRRLDEGRDRPEQRERVLGRRGRGAACRLRFADSTNSAISARSSARTGSAAGASHMQWPSTPWSASTRAKPRA